MAVLYHEQHDIIHRSYRGTKEDICKKIQAYLPVVMLHVFLIVGEAHHPVWHTPPTLQELLVHVEPLRYTCLHVLLASQHDQPILVKYLN